MKKVVFTFGRYNPPTKGHAELITYAVKYAQKTGAEHRIYTSQSHDPAKNPLSAAQKIRFLRQIFPGVNFVADRSAITAFAICRKLADEGYDDVTFVVGDDRVAEFKSSLTKYVKPKTAKDYNPKIHYPFKKFQVISSGARKKGVSGTDLRNYIRKGDFASFAKVSAAPDKTLARKIFDATRAQLNEHVIMEEMGRKEFTDHLNTFIDFCCDKLEISQKPSLKFKEPTDQGEQPSFAAYAPGSKEVMVMSKNRHPMDIFRSVAHELVHHKQNEEGRIGKDVAKEGATGSDIENEANSRAGELMRWFGKANPQCFGMSYVKESKAIVMGGVPGSGKDRILKEAILPHGFREIPDSVFSKEDCTGENLVINGTMSNVASTNHIKNILEAAGYDTIMVFVNTSNQVSRQRNEARAETGGRVLEEARRFTKWKNAQDNLDRFDEMFGTVIVVQNDLNLNESAEVVQKTHEKLIEMVSEDIRKFVLSPTDKQFERMLEGYSDFSINNRQNPTGGAGNWGTSKLTDRYKSDTPGEFPGKTLQMGFFQHNKDKVKVFGNLPKTNDRIGATATSAKNPSFTGDITGDINPAVPFEPVSNWNAIDRWAMREETKTRFKARYGKLAEQKMKETVNKLRNEGLWDAAGSSGFTGATPNAGNAADDARPDINAEFEKMAIMKPKKKLNTKNQS